MRLSIDRQTGKHPIRLGNLRYRCLAALRPAMIVMCLFGLLVISLVGCEQKQREIELAATLPDESPVELNQPAVIPNADKVETNEVVATTVANDTSEVDTDDLNEPNAIAEPVATNGINESSQVDDQDDSNPNPESVEPSAPTSTNAIAKIGDFKPNETIDRTQPIIDDNGLKILPDQLHKNSTLLVLASKPDIRANYVIMTSRTILNSEQLERAKQLALSYDDQFLDLKRQRSAILETATDSNDVDRRLLRVQIELALLLRQIRTRINTDIMTQDQREELKRIFVEKMAAKASREAAIAKANAALAKENAAAEESDTKVDQTSAAVEQTPEIQIQPESTKDK